MRQSIQIQLKVVPGAKKNLLKQEGAVYKVYLTAPAVEGKANKALVDFLAQEFKVRKRQIEIIKGLKSRDKIIMIDAI
jgi:hypothetical protein